MSDRAQLVGVILLVAAFAAGYAVCRRPGSGPQVGIEAPDVEQPASADKTDWSPKSIADPRLRGVVEELVNKFEGLGKLFVSMKTTMPEAAGMAGKTEGDAKYYLKRTDSVTLRRFRIFNNFSIDQEKGAKLITGEEILQLFDGEYLYLSINQPSNQTITKAFYDPARMFHAGGLHLFASIFNDSDVELVGEERVGEWDTQIIVSKPKKGDWSTKYWFDKATGVQVKLVETNAAGLDQLTMITQSIDTDPVFEPDRFQIKIPESYKIIDETVEP